MTKTKQKLFLILLSGIFLLTLTLSQSGCALIGVMATPTRYEEEVPAEFKILDYKNKKLLILVRQPYWLNSEVNFNYYLTKAVKQYLEKKAKFPSKQIIDYETLADFRAENPNASLLTPPGIGNALNADLVLAVHVDSCQLQKIADSDYYKGALNARAMIFDTKTKQKLWPASDEAKTIKISFDLESNGLPAAMSRLSNAAAHCITRFLYDCKEAHFKIKEDKSDPAWDYWN